MARSTRENNNSMAYSAMPSSRLMAIHSSKRYCVNNIVSHNAGSLAPSLASIHCGQALAGTGALVFEGELLELPR